MEKNLELSTSHLPSHSQSPSQLPLQLIPSNNSNSQTKIKKYTYLEQMFDQANLKKEFYVYQQGLQPCAYFFKQLATDSHSPICNVPDTLIINDKDHPLIQIYTDFNVIKEKNYNRGSYLNSENHVGVHNLIAGGGLEKKNNGTLITQHLNTHSSAGNHNSSHKNINHHNTLIKQDSLPTETNLSTHHHLNLHQHYNAAYNTSGLTASNSLSKNSCKKEIQNINNGKNVKQNFFQNLQNLTQSFSLTVFSKNSKNAPLSMPLPKVCKSYTSNLKDFVYKITQDSKSMEDITGCLKRATYGQHFITGNDIKLFNTDFLQNCSLHQIQKKETVVILQKFIKSSGPKAYICRTIWKNDMHSVSFIITSKKRFDEQKQPQNKRFIAKIQKKYCDIVKTLQGKHLQQTSFYLKNIADYFRTYKGKTLTELVGDFIKDENGIWWLINIKAFKIDQKLSLNISSKILNNAKNLQQNLNCLLNSSLDLSASGNDKNHQKYQKQKYQKTKICRYCEKYYLQPQLKYRMTIKMLIQTDKYLLHLGKNYKWLQRSDINNVDSHCLYQEHKICQRCYRLYIQIQQLMEVQNQLAGKMGIDTQKTPKQLIQCSADTQQLEIQSKNKEIQHLKENNEIIPEILQLGPNSNIIIKQNIPIKNNQIINKMIRYRLILYFKEFDEISQIKPNTNYFLEYNILGIKHKIKLDTNLYMENQKTLPIRKMKIIYFFANNHQHVFEYATQNQFLTINLVIQNKLKGQRKLYGKLNLSLKQYFSIKRCRKDYYKLFYVEKVAYGWGLEGSIGLIPSKEYVNTSRVVLTSNNKLIYIPNQDFYFCEALPQDWLDRLKLKPKEEKKLPQLFKNSLSLAISMGNIFGNSRNASRFVSNYNSRQTSFLNLKNYCKDNRQASLMVERFSRFLDDQGLFETNQNFNQIKHTNTSSNQNAFNLKSSCSMISRIKSSKNCQDTPAQVQNQQKQNNKNNNKNDEQERMIQVQKCQIKEEQILRDLLMTEIFQYQKRSSKGKKAFRKNQQSRSRLGMNA